MNIQIIHGWDYEKVRAETQLVSNLLRKLRKQTEFINDSLQPNYQGGEPDWFEINVRLMLLPDLLKKRTQ